MMHIINVEDSFYSKNKEPVSVHTCFFTYYHLEVALEYLIKYKEYLHEKYKGINHHFQIVGINQVSPDCDRNIMEALGMICLDSEFEEKYTVNKN